MPAVEICSDRSAAGMAEEKWRKSDVGGEKKIIVLHCGRNVKGSARGKGGSTIWLPLSASVTL